MRKLINNLKENTKVEIDGIEYIVKTKTWYSLEEDNSAEYIKCELSNGKVLVVIPDDELVYIGEVIENMMYKRIGEEEIDYLDEIYSKTGDGHQYITSIEFGDKEEVEGRCAFEDYESENHIVSLGILTDKNNVRADVYATIISKEDIKFI